MTFFSTVMLPEIFERKMSFELKLECIIQCLVGKYILMHFSESVISNILLLPYVVKFNLYFWLPKSFEPFNFFQQMLIFFSFKCGYVCCNL